MKKIWKAIDNSTFLIVIFTTALCFLFMKLSVYSIAIGGSASSIWPVTGINLGLVLLLGYRVWPGIFIASLLGNIDFSIFSFDDPFVIFNDFTTLISALNNVLHAVLGCWLARRFQCYPNSFINPSNILKFYLVVGLLPSLVTSIIGITILDNFGTNLSNSSFQAWIAWCFSDLVSVCIFTTMTLAIVLFDTQRKLIVMSVSTAAFIISYGIFLVNQSWDKERQDLYFTQQVTDLEHAIVDSTDKYQSILSIMNGLIKNPDGISRQGFKSFASSILPDNPNILSVNWNAVVLYSELENFEKELFFLHGHKVDLMEMTNNESASISKRNEYVFVKYFETNTDIAMVESFDLLVDENRHSMLREAAISRAPTLTPPVLKPSNEDGTLTPIYLATYDGDRLLGYSTYHYHQY